MWPNAQFPTDLVTFPEEIFMENFNFSVASNKRIYLISTANKNEALIRNLTVT